MVLLLIGLTVGRAVAAALLLRMGERRLMQISLTLSAALGAGLATAHTAIGIASFAVLLGLCLAPVFPASFAILIGKQPRARQVGVVLASSGLGAAALPWLMGVISTHTGSLQIALGVPVAAALVLLGLTFLEPADSVEVQ
jgi:FHS family glucose/mannose:H+ symporter-like MFS transporter